MVSPRHRLLVTAVFVLLAIVLLERVADPDLWYHLVIGREVARTGHVPAAEFYVYTVLGAPTGFHEYGFGLLFYLSYAGLGVWGLSLLNAAVGIAVLWAFYGAARIGNSARMVPLLLLVIAFTIADYRLSFRAEELFYLALGVEILLLERYLLSADPRWLLPIPALALALANVHPSALVLLIVLAAYFAQAVLGDLRTGRAPMPQVAVFGAALLTTASASLLNPYGVSQLLLPLRFAQQERLLGATEEFVPTLSTTRGPLLLVLCVVAVAVLLPRKRRLVDALLLVCFAVLAFRHVRNVAVFALVLCVPAARCLDGVGCRFELSRRRRTLGDAVTLAAAALVAALAIRSPEWGVGIVRERFPVAAADWIAEHKPPGKLFNYPHLGGYLAWRLFDGYLVAVDGRHYYGWDRSLEIADEVFRAGAKHDRILRDYGVTMIVTPATAQFVGSLVPLVMSLDRDAAWSLVSVEPAALLFVRRETLPEARAVPLDKKLIWQQVLADTTPLTAENAHPAATACLARGIASLKLHEFADAQDWLGRYVAEKPADAPALQLLQDLKAAAAGDDAAKRRLEEMAGDGVSE